MRNSSERETLRRILRPEWNRGMNENALFDLAQEHRDRLPHDIEPTLKAISPYQPLIIARNDDSQYFVGRADLSDEPDFVMDWLVNKPSGGRKTKSPIANLFDETDVIEAEYQALLYEAFIPIAGTEKAVPPDRQLILKFSNPHRRGDSTRHPEIFTARSVFNDDLLAYPMAYDEKWILRVGSHPEMRKELIPMARAFLQSGIQFLSMEPQNETVKQTGKRLGQLYYGPLWDRVFLTSNPEYTISESGYDGTIDDIYPAPESIAFIPAKVTNQEEQVDETLQRLLRSQGNVPSLGDLIIPVGWLHTCATKPHQALAYLLRAGSLARDHSFGKLLGKEYIAGRGFPPEEIERIKFAARRADDQMHLILKEAQQYDASEFGIILRMDAYCHKILQYRPRAAHYDNPDHDNRLIWKFS